MALLFHYHWWTSNPEKMENFYKKMGFQVTLRIGMENGETKAFNPPLEWEDFRNKKIAFRIIEMRKGKTNLTFGQGKRNQFDHIGFLVDDDEYKGILSNARKLEWKINEGDRRTFVATPWKFRIELQKRKDTVTNDEDMYIKRMNITLPFHQESPEVLAELFDAKANRVHPEHIRVMDDDWIISFSHSKDLGLQSIEFLSDQSFQQVDPAGTILQST